MNGRFRAAVTGRQGERMSEMREFGGVAFVAS